MFLVHADDTEARHGSEHRGARADHDRRFATCNTRALVPSLRLGQRRMKDRDAFAEAFAKAADGLRREGDLGNENDCTPTALECDRAGLEIDLGLPASRRSVEEEVRALLGVERADDAIEGCALRRAELGRLGLAGQPVALGRLRPLAAGLPLYRGDECKRASRGRAVVLRKPERELDKGLRQLFDDTLDRRGLDSPRRRDVHLRDDTPSLRIAETHFDDRAQANVIGDLVGELTRERARRYERIDRGIPGHPSSLEPGRDARRLRLRG